ncbi:MAG: MBL fold metallo-hydrolase [Nitrospira sp.]|nr:MBL fold metallo-hydrolase [Nitrospira sp.]
MRICIHRETQEVGGTCIEIESAGKRIVLDVGLPLEAEDSKVSLPHVKGFREREPSLLAVVISHPHQDHYGLAKYLLPDTPMIMGAAAERILKAACLFTPAGVAFQRIRHLEPRIPLSVGPFTLTPFLNDHLRTTPILSSLKRTDIGYSILEICAGMDGRQGSFNNS